MSRLSKRVYIVNGADFTISTQESLLTTAHNALIVYEHASGMQAQWPVGVSALSTKRYGTTEIEIAVYERGAGSA